MTIHYQDGQVTLHLGDALTVARELSDGSADCIVTSPPYFGLRDYGTEGQYGLENSPAEYVERMRALFHELRRVLADDGTLWLNIGDSYSHAGRAGNGSRPGAGKVEGRAANRNGLNAGDRTDKNLLGIPWRTAFALQDDGWILRNAIIWNKPNAMPEPVKDRVCTRYEHVFLFSKQARYWFDIDPIREEYSPAGIQRRNYKFNPAGATHRARIKSNASLQDGGTIEVNPLGRNPGDVWTIPTAPFSDAHFAVFPVALPQRCILAGCRPGGTVLDPFSGSGTTGAAAQQAGRNYVGIDINPEYLDLSLNHPKRLKTGTLNFDEQETPA